MSAPGARKGKDCCPHECECEAQPIRSRAMWVHPNQDGDRGAKRGDLGKGEIHKDHAALHHVYAKVSVDSRQNQACHEWPEKELQNLHSVLWTTGMLFSASRYRNRTAQNSLSPVSHPQRKAGTPSLLRRWRNQCCWVSSSRNK